MQQQFYACLRPVCKPIPAASLLFPLACRPFETNTGADARGSPDNLAPAAPHLEAGRLALVQNLELLGKLDYLLTLLQVGVHACSGAKAKEARPLRHLGAPKGSTQDRQTCKAHRTVPTPPPTPSLRTCGDLEAGAQQVDHHARRGLAAGANHQHIATRLGDCGSGQAAAGGGSPGAALRDALASGHRLLLGGDAGLAGGRCLLALGAGQAGRGQAARSGDCWPDARLHPADKAILQPAQAMLGLPLSIGTLTLWFCMGARP